MLLSSIFLIWFHFYPDNPAIVEKTAFSEAVRDNGEQRGFNSAGTSLEGFLYGQSGIFERYPEASIECYEEPCIRPEGFVEEQERISALHIGIIEKIGKDFESEEFYWLMMVGENPTDCSAEYDEYEMFISCVAEEYLNRKKVLE